MLHIFYYSFLLILTVPSHHHYTEQPYILFANREFIQRVNLDGSELELLVDSSHIDRANAVALDYDIRYKCNNCIPYTDYKF